jgi:hypothetical protein
MTRRTRPLLAAAAIIAIVVGSTSPGHAATAQEAASVAPAIPTPTPAQLVWQDCEIGLLFCFDIGHKWIYRFESQTVSALRLRITKSLAAPKIRSFSCFMIGKP